MKYQEMNEKIRFIPLISLNNPKKSFIDNPVSSVDHTVFMIMAAEPAPVSAFLMYLFQILCQNISPIVCSSELFLDTCWGTMCKDIIYMIMISSKIFPTFPHLSFRWQFLFPTSFYEQPGRIVRSDPVPFSLNGIRVQQDPVFFLPYHDFLLRQM